MDINLQTQNSPREIISFSQLGTVMLVAVLLLSVEYMKNPQLFSMQHSQNKISAAAQKNVPHYYAYVPPVRDTAPMVAGASTMSQGPSVIGEDGSIISVSNQGAVLGASTQNDVPAVPALHSVSDSQEAVDSYISDSKNTEQGYFDNFSFEQALDSRDAAVAQQEITKINSIVTGLAGIEVPASFVKYHQYKIASYQAAVDMLKALPLIQTDPQSEADALKRFSQAQKSAADELQQLNQKFDLQTNQ